MAAKRRKRHKKMNPASTALGQLLVLARHIVATANAQLPAHTFNLLRLFAAKPFSGFHSPRCT
jgi:hypothetical protein